MNIKPFLLTILFFSIMVSRIAGQEFIDPISESQYNTWVENSEMENQQMQDSLSGVSKQERINYLETFFSFKITELNAKYDELKNLSEKKFAKKEDISQFQNLMEDILII